MEDGGGWIGSLNGLTIRAPIGANKIQISANSQIQKKANKQIQVNYQILTFVLILLFTHNICSNANIQLKTKYATFHL